MLKMKTLKISILCSAQHIKVTLLKSQQTKADYANTDPILNHTIKEQCHLMLIRT